MWVGRRCCCCRCRCHGSPLQDKDLQAPWVRPTEARRAASHQQHTHTCLARTRRSCRSRVVTGAPRVLREESQVRRSGTRPQERRCVLTSEYGSNRVANESKRGHPGAREGRSENTREHPTPEADTLAYAFEFPPDKRQKQPYNIPKRGSPGRLRSRCQRPGPGAAGHHDARPRPSSRTHRPPGPALRVAHDHPDPAV